MKTTQPPITNDQEYAGYRAGAEQLRQMIERHESDLMVERQKAVPDMRLIDQIRAKGGLTVARDERGAIKRTRIAAAQPAANHDLVALPGVGTDHGN